jgi:acetolactate decarboxylase
MSKRTIIPIIAILLTVTVCLAMCEFWQTQNVTATQTDGTIYQAYLFNVFSNGDYDGNVTYAQLAQHGGFGIGTLTGLDGEMIALDGVFYQVPSDGNIREISSTEKTPFAEVTFFKTDQTLQITDLNYTQMAAFLNQSFPDPNGIYAIKIHGTYDYAKTRSPPLQTPPYPNLTIALTNQTVWTLTDVEATAVGYYFPASLDGVNYAGFHLHLITDDRTQGGHLLDCIVGNVTVEIDFIHNLDIDMP